jgi:acetyl esterase/lipase
MKVSALQRGQMVSDLAYGPSPAHRLDLYRPDVEGSVPLLVLVHGGGWAMGDKSNPRFIADKVTRWLSRGWMLAAVNYRLLPWAVPMAQAEDLGQALAFIHANVARWGVDSGRIVLAGHSTGAHLAALVLTHPALRPPSADAWPAAAVLLDSAALDVPAVMRGPHLPLFDRAFGVNPADWVEASPWHQLCAPTAPLLLIPSSLRDESMTQAQRFAERAQAAGGRADVVPIPLSHREINDAFGRDGELTRSVDGFLQSLGLC